MPVESDNHAIIIKRPDAWDTFLETDRWKIYKHLAFLELDLVKAVGVAWMTRGIAWHTYAAQLIASRNSAIEIYKELTRLPSDALSWVFLDRAMTATVSQLLIDADVHDESAVKAMLSLVDEVLEESSISIDAAFWTQLAPAFIERVHERLIERLKSHDVGPEFAREVTRELRPMFQLLLRSAFVEQYETFGRLHEETATPLDDAVSQEQQWLKYDKFLIAQAQEPVFNGEIRLNQIYIPLRCYLEAHVLDETDAAGDPGEAELDTARLSDQSRKTVYRDVHMLEEFVDAWLDRLDAGDTSEPAYFLTGDPGSGKSTSAKMIAAKVAQERLGWRVVFVPLQRLQYDGSWKSAVTEFCLTETPQIPANPLEVRAAPQSGVRRKTLLIFDGLDELYKTGEGSKLDADQFVNVVTTRLSNQLADECLAALVCGRPLAVASSTRTFDADERPVITVMSYEKLVEKTYDEKKHRFPFNRYRDHSDQALLAIDQREQWWERYAPLVDLDDTGCPKRLKKGSPKITELTYQPLLGYLVALVYQSDFDFRPNTNSADVYHNLLTDVLGRSWDDKQVGPVTDATKNFTNEELDELYEAIAYSSFQLGGRVTTHAAVRDVLEEWQKEKFDGFTSVSGENEQNRAIDEGVRSLFLGFFVQPGGSEQAFEFTHKSFGEYLTARYLLRNVRNLAANLKRYKAGDPRNGTSESDTLESWLELFSTAPLTREVVEFIDETVASELHGCAPEDQQQILELTVALLNRTEQQSFPVEPIHSTEWPAATVDDLFKRIAAADEALFVWHSILWRSLTEDDAELAPSKIAWSSRTSAASRLLRITGQWHYEDNNPPIAHQSLNGISFDKQILHALLLFRANLSGADLSGADLSRADLSGADLSGADLRRADLKRARNLTSSQLTDTEGIPGLLPDGSRPSGKNWRDTLPDETSEDS